MNPAPPNDVFNPKSRPSTETGNRKRWSEIVGGTKQFPKFEDKVLIASSQELSGCALSQWKGMPALDISSEALKRAHQPYAKSVILKMLGTRPPFSDFHRNFMKLNFVGEVNFASLNFNKILVTFSFVEDFTRLISRRIWKIGETFIRVYRCPSDLTPEIEPPSSPIWFIVPNPSLLLFDRIILTEIARIFGDPLMIDTATSNRSRPSQARFLVEVDLSRDIPSGCWLKGEGADPVWQDILPESIPPLCACCGIVGHSDKDCKRKSAGTKLGIELRNKQLMNPSKNSENNNVWKKVGEGVAGANPQPVVLLVGQEDMQQEMRAEDVEKTANGGSESGTGAVKVQMESQMQKLSAEEQELIDNAMMTPFKFNDIRDIRNSSALVKQNGVTENNKNFKNKQNTEVVSPRSMNSWIWRNTLSADDLGMAEEEYRSAVREGEKPFQSKYPITSRLINERDAEPEGESSQSNWKVAKGPRRSARLKKLKFKT